MPLLRRFLPTNIRNKRELNGFVLRITFTCIAIAVAVDVVNQLVFFESWAIAVRSWTISAALAAILAAPISGTIGKAYLELFRAKQVVEKLSRTDPLTGLANRRALIETAETAGAAAVLILVIFDIDRFKRINDAHGHIAGDAVIAAVAATMTEHLGALGLLCRLGGEEFALLANNQNMEDVLDGVWAMRDRLAATPIVTGEIAVEVTVSAGVAARQPGGTFTQLYADADRALYVAKTSGRNRVDYAAPLTPREADRRRWRSNVDAGDAVA
ncbi:MAG TPA: GGDEF domain-containing protein [Bauldia sp.]|nr:GGDEF domain-containing protein [Bauldia sp.]